MSASEPKTANGSKSEPMSAGLYSKHDLRFDSKVLAPGESRVWGGVFNYTNVIVGSGIVGIPYAMYNCGLWLGVILMVVTGLFTALASHWIIKMGIKRHRHNYEDLCRNVLGRAGGYLYCVTAFCFTYSSTIAYVIVTGQSLRDVSRGLGATGVFANEKFYIALCAVFVMLPLSCFRDMHHLRLTSTISIVTEVGIMLLIVFYSRAYSLQENNVVPFHEAKSERLTYFTGPDVFAGLATFLFALIGQHASFEVFRSLKEPSVSNWKMVVNSAVFLAGILSVMVGVSSWLNLGDQVEGNVMDTFGPSDIPTLVGKVFLAITMNLTYPMDFYVCRQNVNQGIFVNFFGMSDYMPFWRFSLITLTIWGTSVTIGLSFDDLTSVLGLGGAIGGSSAGFIMPSILYLNVFKSEIMDAFQKSKLHGLYWAILPIACLLFGIMALVAGTVATVLDIFH
eukprot:50322_1